MEIIFVIIRYIHVITAVFWGGGVFMLNFFIFPYSKSIGTEGGKFMQGFSRTNSFPVVMTYVGFAVILSGLIVLWHYSAGFSSAFMGAKMGILLSIGGFFGLMAFFHGMFINRPTIMKINKIGDEISKSGAPPSAGQMQEIDKLRNKIFTTTKMITLYTALAISFMALAKYL